MTEPSERLEIDFVAARAEAMARVGSAIDGKWRVDALIGVGGMGAVYAATHESGRRAAFKSMHRALANDPELVDRFLDERAISQKIAHPACVSILAVGATDDGVPLLFMELLEGETLESALRRGARIDGAHALSIAEHLLDFLVACHGRGVVHRDLKPSNVFLLRDKDGALARDGGVKVIDFGVAREGSRRRTKRRLAIGTPGFMAPEQARGAAVDGRADIFAVGAMLHALLGGKEAEATVATNHEAPRSLAVYAPTLPAPVIALVMRALAWEPRDRFEGAAQMLAELHRVRDLFDLRDHVPLVRWLQGPKPTPALDDRPTDPSTPSAIRRLLDAPIEAA
jgi:serine/threonine protein kinase